MYTEHCGRPESRLDVTVRPDVETNSRVTGLMKVLPCTPWNKAVATATDDSPWKREEALAVRMN